MRLHFPMPKIRTIAVSSHFPLPKIALFVSPFTLPVSPLWRWNSQFTLYVAKKFAPLCSDSLSLSWMARAARRVIENPRQMIKFCPVLLFFPSKKWIKLIPKTIGNRKRDCAWGGSIGVINLTWENLPIAKHKSGRRSFMISSADWFVLCDL